MNVENKNWLKTLGWGDAQQQRLPSDASRRTYTRLVRESGTAMLMVAPPPEDPRPFIRIARFLQSLGFSAPKILAENLEQGLLLLEDFGDKTFTHCIKKGDALQPLYDLAVDTLIALHQKVEPKDAALFQPFTVDILCKEACALIDLYVPFRGISLSEEAQQNYRDLWEKALATALKGPFSLVLRDYHVDNLMILGSEPKQCGLLDFQDAVWGPVVFDLVSLLEDARIDLPEDLIESCWRRYEEAFPQFSSDQLRRDGCILSAARHAKIIGYFTAFVQRDGKPQYAAHLPRVWRLLQRCLQHPDLRGIAQWFQKNDMLLIL